ncbi:MAG: hypothetical protein ACODAD_05135, partial [Planctomycetota bacterium]
MTNLLVPGGEFLPCKPRTGRGKHKQLPLYVSKFANAVGTTEPFPAAHLTYRGRGGQYGTSARGVRNSLGQAARWDDSSTSGRNVMGGFCGVAAKEDCIPDLFYGTDYHSHLGTVRGGMAVHNGTGFKRLIKDITNAQFRSKFEDDLHELSGPLGIGIISDYDDQPMLIRSHLGTYALVTVGRIDNLEELTEQMLKNRSSHFSEMSGDLVNPTELVATLINQGHTFVEGIRHAQETISGSCSLLLMTGEAIYAARDRFGRTPVALGRKPGAHAVVMETCAFPNLDYETQRHLGPAEILRITAETTETVQP